VVALVGYTNAGKSTLLRRLTDAVVLIEDRLFSTLDPTTRRLELAHRSVLLTDTVGFVRKLPHQLVEAFRSTLEEVGEASLLLHIVDATRDPQRQIDAVSQVLNDIGMAERPTLLVMNKTDLLTEDEVGVLRGRFPDAAFCSAGSGEGIDELLEKLSEELSRLRVEVTLEIPFARGDLVARVHERGEVMQETYDESGTRLVARMPRELLEEFGSYLAEVG
jgi:GTP-binding protein HflX